VVGPTKVPHILEQNMIICKRINDQTKFIMLFIGLLLLVLLQCIYVHHIVYASVETIKASSEDKYPPFCFIDPDGKADGFSVELLRAALEAVDRNVDFTAGSWDQIKKDLALGKIQVLPLVGRTPEREDIYDFTFPYLTLHGAIFVRKGDRHIKTIKDLVNKEVIVMKGDNAEEYMLRKHGEINTVAVETYEKAMMMLASGKHDAVICQELMGLELLKELNIKSIVPTVNQIDDFRQDFTFAVKDGDKELLATLNEGLAIIIADGTYDTIYEKWFRPLFKLKVTFNDVAKYIFNAMVPIVFVMALFLIFILRIQVERKTKHLQKEIAERKVTEENLKFLNDDLEQFAYIVSHNLKAPLKIIIGFSHLLEKRYKDIIDDEGKKDIDFIVIRAQGMDELIEDLLKYAKIGREPVPFTEVDWNLIYDQVVNNE